MNRSRGRSLPFLHGASRRLRVFSLHHSARLARASVGFACTQISFFFYFKTKNLVQGVFV